MVDEIRTIGERHTDSIRALHEGRHGLPIVLVCAGLADSRETLVNNGASRMQIANVDILGAPAPDECASCVKRMLDSCRIGCSEARLEPVTEGIAERSEGWSQHLRTETAALFRGLDKAGCDFGKVNIEEVEDMASDHRKRSCGARRSKEMRKAVELVAAVMAAVPEDGLREGKVVGIIRRTVRSDDVDHPEWCLPEGMDADMFLDHLIHRGALQLEEDDKLSCPIPIFRTWLIDQGSDAQHKPLP